MSFLYDRKGVFLPIVVSAILLCSVFSAGPSVAGTTTLEEQEPQYKYTTRPSEKVFIEKKASQDSLVHNAMAGVIYGVDLNPLVDPSKKTDSYIEETTDMHFQYPLADLSFGRTKSIFGFNIANINYFKVTDVNILDTVVDARVEQEVFDRIVVGAGYAVESLYFPNNSDGTYVSNEFNADVKHKITDRIYQKGTYRLLIKNYTDRNIQLADKTVDDQLRFDVRNTFEYELGVYIGSKTKFRVFDQFYINNSNEEYQNYYDYLNNKVGCSLVRSLTKKLCSVTTFYYQFRRYYDRYISDGNTREKDDYYMVSTSLLYDLAKDVSVFFNYSHIENHSNEPTEKYADSTFESGLYYSF